MNLKPIKFSIKNILLGSGRGLFMGFVIRAKIYHSNLHNPFISSLIRQINERSSGCLVITEKLLSRELTVAIFPKDVTRK